MPQTLEPAIKREDRKSKRTGTDDQYRTALAWDQRACKQVRCR
jgi:hypothetical protein